jgi:threonine/homoserine/homoserine lactone efflux protein
MGDFAFMSAAVLGIAGVMNAHPSSSARCSGSESRTHAGSERGGVNVAPRTGWRYLQEGFAVSLTNPKVILFFVSFFPQFLKPGSSFVTLVILVGHVTMISLLYQSALVLTGDRVARRLKVSRAFGTTTKRLAGVALIAFSARLALKSR